MTLKCLGKPVVDKKHDVMLNCCCQNAWIYNECEKIICEKLFPVELNAKAVRKTELRTTWK